MSLPAYRCFGSTASSARPLDVSDILRRNAPGAEWVALEKVHGANFMVASGGGCAAFGKRTACGKSDTVPLGYLVPGRDKFFGFEAMTESLTQHAVALEQLVGEPVIVYGELCGGHYGSKGGKPVQKGIWYHPDKLFLAFDVFVPRISRSMPYQRARELAEQAGFQYVPEVARGSLEELLELEIEGGQSRVPELFGLDPLPDNQWEGVVLRPVAIPGVRLKRKTLAFHEVAHGKSSAAKMAAEKATATPELLAAAEEACRYITRMRYDGMVGKLGPDAPEGRLVHEVVQDALQSISEEEPELGTRLAALEKKATQTVSAILHQAAKAVHQQAEAEESVDQ